MQSFDKSEFREQASSRSMPFHRAARKETALITGASAGLGLQFAQCFAQDGYDLVLIARSEERLEKARSQLLEQYDVAIQVIAEDLCDHQAVQRIIDQLETSGTEIGALVNNAGFGLRGSVLELSLEAQLQMIQLNISALTEMSHRFAKQMVERGRGKILNVASTAAFQPGPLMAVYYASKAYVLSFSEALAFELKGTGVTVTCHCPGATATEFSKRANLEHSRLFSVGVASAESVARHGYRSMQQGKVLATPGILNWLGTVLVGFAPRTLVPRIVARLHGSAKPNQNGTTGS